MPKFMPTLTVALIAGILALSAHPLRAAEPAPAQALSPAVQSAISDLGSDDFKTRENALLKLETALGNQMKALVASDDPEIQSRLIALLQFNEGLTRWIADTYKLPADQRKAAIDFGLQPDVLPLLALVFSPDPDKRVEGAKLLAKIDKPEATVLLGRLLTDPERAVYIAAMEAVWDKKPTDAIVDALWDRAVDAGINAFRGNVNAGGAAQQNLKFRGRNIGGVVYYDNAIARKSQDSNIATDVLINLKAPQVAAKIKGFLDEYQRSTGGNNPNPNLAWIYSGNSEPMKNALRLIAAYKSKDALTVLYKIATAPATQQSQTVMNGEKCFWSNRTSALATLVTALDLKPEDYKLKRAAMMGGTWTTPTLADEDDAVKKIQEYWTANADAIAKLSDTPDPNKKSSDATHPADPDPTPAQPNIIIQGNNGGLQFRGNMRIQIAPAPAQNDAGK